MKQVTSKAALEKKEEEKSFNEPTGRRSDDNGRQQHAYDKEAVVEESKEVTALWDCAFFEWVVDMFIPPQSPKASSGENQLVVRKESNSCIIL